MTEQQVKQAAIERMNGFRVAAFLYTFEVRRIAPDFGMVIATNTNRCEWTFYYEIADGALARTQMDVCG